MERIEAGKRSLILGDATQTKDFVYTEDIARGNLMAAASDATEEVFNLGRGTETRLPQLATVLLGTDQTLEFEPPGRINPVTRRLAEGKQADDRG